MLTLLHWNVRDKSSEPLLAQLCSDALMAGGNDPTSGSLICCATEGYGIKEANLQSEFRKLWPSVRWRTFGTGSFMFITNTALSLLECREFEAGAFHMRLIRGKDRYLISFVHLASPFGKWCPELTQSHRAADLRRAIEKREGKWGCSSVAIGDFNMDPFHYGMTSVDGLNAAMCRAIAVSGPRAWGPSKEIKTEYFYNLMWPFFGDRNADRQPGTFYHQDVQDSMYWRAIDQVIVRPDLINLVKNKAVTLTKAGTTELIVNGKIDETLSDHLPVTVTIEI